MARKGFKSITLSNEEEQRITKYCIDHRTSKTKMLESIDDESMKLRRFAEKITKVPEQVRRYT